MLPAGNGMGVMCGMNRNMKMARPNYQGIASPSMLNSGNILPSGTATPNPAAMHSGPGPGPGPGQGNSILRPRDGMHMIRPNQNPDHQKVVAADLQMQQVSQGGVSQVSQGGVSQGVPAFGGGTSSSFPNQISQPPVQAYPLHHQQQSRPISPQQSPHLLSGGNSHHPHHFQGPPNPAYGMRLVKERQLQQQRLQQQQFSTSNAMMQESQLPVSSPQNSTQMQSRSSSPPVSISPMMTTPMPQLPQKHPVSAPVGLVRNPQTSGNQMVKQQRQRQFQQRQPAQQHQQQPAKLMKGGRGTMMMNQNHPTTDTSQMNGFSGGQSTSDKGEQQVLHHLPQSGQGSLYSGKQSLPHSSMTQPHDNNNNRNHAPSPSMAASSTPSVIASSNHHHPHQSQPQQKPANQKQAATPQKALHIRKVNPSDQLTSKLQAQAEPSTTHAPCNDANSRETLVGSSSAAPHRKQSEMVYDSCGVVPDNAGTQFGKNSVRVSPPRISGVGTESEHSGPAVNQAAVRRQSSSESLPNPVRNDVGVQWQQQQPPS